MFSIPLSLCIYKYKYLLSLRLTKLAYMLAYDVFRTGEIWFGLVNDSNHQSECLVMVFNECHTLSQDSKNPTEKPVGETEKKGK